MWDGEHLRRERPGILLEQGRLSRLLHLAGQQDPPISEAHREHVGGLVQLAVRVPVGAAGWGMQHGDLQVTERHPLPTYRGADRDPGRGGGATDVHRGG